jgi:predicted small secreted protein
LVKRISIVIAAAAAIVLSGCNTMAGLGKDIEKGGEIIQKGAGK